MKKKWQKPKLQVIVRSPSEEKVLATCKYESRTGPDSGDNHCRTAICQACGQSAVS